LADIPKIVFECIDELNKQLPVGGKLAKTDDTIVAGEQGVLDSLGLITLCVGIEQALSDRLGLQCAVLDELMSERTEHPLRTVGAMVQWLSQQANSA
jgi:hypothetical protein